MAWVQARTTKSGKVRYRAYWRDPSGKISGKVFARKPARVDRITQRQLGRAANAVADLIAALA